MENLIIKAPENTAELNDYYQLRYEVLRKPWNMPLGSEKDSLDKESDKLAAFFNDHLIACGRLHMNSDTEAQVRFMATDPNFRGMGVGAKLLGALENIAKLRHAKTVILEARENAKKFYESQGYGTVKKSYMLFGTIQHYLMSKQI